MPVKLSLRIAFSENPMVQPLKEGRVKPNNIELEFVTVAHPGDLFYRNLKFNEFDVSEMGIPWTIRALEINDPRRWDWAKLPVFLSRGTGWTNLYVNTTSGINSLYELKGKKICVPEYNTSMCIWLRVIMKDFFGINPEDNIWYLARTKDQNQGGALGVVEDKPEGVSAFWLTEEQTADAMLEKGEIDAAIIHPGTLSATSIDRYSGALPSGNSRIRKLFADDGRSLIDQFSTNAGVFQINHHVIIQNRILREHPWVALELFTALQLSKDIALAIARQQKPGDSENDEFPVGVKAMRPSFDRYVQAMLDGKVIKTRFKMEDVYYPTTLET
jgi:4,5-dihydroxyphthalate decarboxylase